MCVLNAKEEKMVNSLLIHQQGEWVPSPAYVQPGNACLLHPVDWGTAHLHHGCRKTNPTGMDGQTNPTGTDGQTNPMGTDRPRVLTCSLSLVSQPQLSRWVYVLRQSAWLCCCGGWWVVWHSCWKEESSGGLQWPAFPGFPQARWRALSCSWTPQGAALCFCLWNAGASPFLRSPSFLVFVLLLLDMQRFWEQIIRSKGQKSFLLVLWSTVFVYIAHLKNTRDSWRY